LSPQSPFKVFPLGVVVWINTTAYAPSHLYNTLEQKSIAVVVVVVVAILS